MLKGRNVHILFVHDHIFRVGADATVFSPGQLPYSTFRRYLEVFSSIEVLARSRHGDIHTSSLNQSSGPNVSFVFDHGFQSPVDFLIARRRIVDSVGKRVMAADAVIARLPSELGQIAVRCALHWKRPLAVEVVGCAFDAYWNYGSIAGRVYAPIMYRRMQRAVAAAPFSLYVTRRFLQQRYRSRGVTAGISDVQLSRSSRDTLSRRLDKVAHEHSDITLGFIGSLRSTYKGLDVALTALRALRLRGRSVRLRVLGDGDQARWRKLATELGVTDAVCFDGVLPAGDAVCGWLDGIDLFIQPSKQEGLPRSLLEAMSRACPAVGSTAGGISELLPPECMHKPGDWRALAQRVEEIAWNPARQAKLATRNWEESNLYLPEKLDAQRRAFWCMFKDYAAQERRNVSL